MPTVPHVSATSLSRRPLGLGRKASAPARDAGRAVCAAQPTSTASSGLGLFPSQQQARVQLPAVVLQVDASQVLADPGTIDAIGQALQGGCNMVVLSDSASNAAAMYDAALRVQEVIRGRAQLLLVDRTDIALAISAQGVLLTDQGVPTVVARRMLTAVGLVGRIVADDKGAVAAAADGANLVIVQTPSGAVPSPAVLTAAKRGQRSGNAIAVVAGVREAGAKGLEAALGADIDGVAVTLEALPAAARACFDLPQDASATDFAQAILTRLNVKAATAGAAAADKPAAKPAEAAKPKSSSAAASAAPATAPAKAPSKPPSKAPAESPSLPTPLSSRPLRRLMDPDREALLAEEKAALGEVLGFLEETLPGVAELGLLRDALKALDEPFLVAVVGEFNSGKSSVINALLGRRYLAEGILPTTNEISILKYDATAPQDADPKELRLEQQADGLYVRYLPAKLLQDLHIVDTPGTNVILERQQRLTEEYVPRADLVLFVMSADRPFSESEVRFLEYIRQWQKKVVFVVNKADILADRGEIEAVKDFVADNARRILKLDTPSVIAVSSRAALRAKLTASGLNITASLDADLPPRTWPVPPPPGTAGTTSLDPEALEAALPSLPDWGASNFSELERQVSNVLVGGKGAGGGEGVRLKLQTPLFVADALLGAAGRQLAADLAAARAELEGVQLVGRQLGRFRAEMDKDAAAQRAALQQPLTEVLGRAELFVDNTIQLSNAPLLLSIATGGKEFPFRAQFEKEVIANGFDSLAGAVAEHSSWLTANCDSQRAYYAAFAASRAEAAGVKAPALPAPSVALSSSGDARADSGSDASTSAPSSAAAKAVAEFNVRAVSTLIDTELQAAMAGTAGTAVGAPLAGLFLMQVVGNTLEDIALGLMAGGVSYVSVLNLPLRRADLKGKISRVATNFINDVQSKMEAEVGSAVAGVVGDVQALMAPLEQAYAGEVARLEARERDLAELNGRLQELQRKTANLE
ncbi:hypothetical protein HYH03_010936 [Edaphochlamys debaryana]|uniref:Uncharacterized protein n=1 Tax=Edaphochlamys debaryana TaxID=47281 RepID=A0A836BW07_9CHLO|nr:hypothetical protein HYH03_010936 [Edaphochlamys debaryana]|eukprot:KAG2490542.1 hypothetical protein HYH03_010936 [Edaphochlamys debaryana]